jgi:hypothetical protein
MSLGNNRKVKIADLVPPTFQAFFAYRSKYDPPLPPLYLHVQARKYDPPLPPPHVLFKLRPGVQMWGKPLGSKKLPRGMFLSSVRRWGVQNPPA